MNRKIIFFIVLVIALIFIFVFSSKRQKQIVNSQVTVKKQPSLKVESLGRNDTEKISIKNMAKPIDDITIDEIESKKSIIKKKEEFDLTPSVEDLIRMKKERIRTY